MLLFVPRTAALAVIGMVAALVLTVPAQEAHAQRRHSIHDGHHDTRHHGLRHHDLHDSTRHNRHKLDTHTSFGLRQSRHGLSRRDIHHDRLRHNRLGLPHHGDTHSSLHHRGSLHHRLSVHDALRRHKRLRFHHRPFHHDLHDRHDFHHRSHRRPFIVFGFDHHDRHERHNVHDEHSRGVTVPRPNVIILDRDDYARTEDRGPRASPWSLLEYGDYDAAMSAFARAAEASPHDGIPKIGYALSAALRGNDDLAAWAFERAERIDPDALQRIRLSEPLQDAVERLIERYEEADDADAEAILDALRKLVDGDDYPDEHEAGSRLYDVPEQLHQPDAAVTDDSAAQETAPEPASDTPAPAE